jgi:hypothetical protein
MINVRQNVAEYILGRNKSLSALKINLEKKQTELKKFKSEFKNSDDDKINLVINAFENSLEKMENEITLTEKALELRLYDPIGAQPKTLEAEEKVSAAHEEADRAAGAACTLKDKYKAQQLFNANKVIFDALVNRVYRTLPKVEKGDFSSFLNSLYYLNQVIACVVTGGNAEQASPDITLYLLDLVYSRKFYLNEDVREILIKMQNTADEALAKGEGDFPQCFPQEKISKMSVDELGKELQQLQLICNDRSNGLRSFLERHPVKSSFLRSFSLRVMNTFSSEEKYPDYQKQLDTYLCDLIHYNEVKVFERILEVIPESDLPYGLFSNLYVTKSNNSDPHVIVINELIGKYSAQIVDEALRELLTMYNLGHDPQRCLSTIQFIIGAYIAKYNSLPGYMFCILQVIWQMQGIHRATDISKRQAINSHDLKLTINTPSSTSSSMSSLLSPIEFDTPTPKILKSPTSVKHSSDFSSIPENKGMSISSPMSPLSGASEIGTPKSLPMSPTSDSDRENKQVPTTLQRSRLFNKRLSVEDSSSSDQLLVSSVKCLKRSKSTGNI